MKNTLIIIILSMVLFACKDPFADSVYSGVSEKLPAATYMEKDTSLNVSLWVALLKHAEMFSTINLQASYTCFVPDNNAVQTYLSSKGMSAVTQMNKDDAKLLVRYHTIKGTKYSSIDFTDGMIPDSTATGDYLTTKFLEGGGAVQVNEEAVIKKTQQVTNAYIHVIDKMLTPVTETLWDKLQSDEYSIFRQAVEITGLKEKLNAIVVTETTSTGATIQRKYRYTMFVVPNSVFAAQEIANINALASYLGADDDYTSVTNELNRYVAYHLLNQQVSYYELSYFADNDKTRSKNYNTMATSQLINVSEKNKTLYINYTTQSASGVKLTLINQNCKNGILHVVDDLMPIKSPAPTKIRWEFTDFPELSYIPFYRKAMTTSTQSQQIRTGEVSCYNWLSVPESRVGLTYVLANRNDNVMNLAINNDYLMLSLGMFGWVEMETPAIVTGKYNVFIEHFNPLSAEKNGKLSFIIDGNYVGAQISTTGSDSKVNKYVKTLIGEVNFTTTTTHKVRILAGDTYSSYLDCLTFEPK